MVACLANAITTSAIPISATTTSAMTVWAMTTATGAAAGPAKLLSECTVFVGGISYDADDDAVTALFEPKGSIERMHMPVWSDSGRKKVAVASP